MSTQIQPVNGTMEINKILNGDCLVHLKELSDNSVDAIITDPPYGLSFMNKKWDYDVPSVEIWIECLRVIKPGGHLLSFAGTRTYHRMTCNIEDAGFDIRDMISWIYGSGFPKSLNIGKQIDKIQGNEREELGEYQHPDGKPRNWKEHKNASSTLYEMGMPKDSNSRNITKGNSEWEGWGTALKPACEPIVVARKPLSEKNVALNVLKWGTGGINIDECRIGIEPIRSSGDKKSLQIWKENDGRTQKDLNLIENTPHWNNGRFPANVILDEEAGDMLDEQSGISNGGKFSIGCIRTSKENIYELGFKKKDVQIAEAPDNYGDKGGASRFFYCAKSSKSERNDGCDELPDSINSNGDKWSDIDRRDGKIPVVRKNHHPTVKPIALMEYLIKLITREGQIVLDPFLGSGTTAIACINLNRNWIGIEKEKDYIEIAQARIFNIKGTSKEDARMKLIDKEDISIDDEVSEGVLIE